jgi:hypothetical protein
MHKLSLYLIILPAVLGLSACGSDPKYPLEQQKSVIDTTTVSAPTPSDKQTLIFDAAKQMWVNGVEDLSHTTGSIGTGRVTGLGALATKDKVADADITGVSAAKVVGDIAGNAASINGTIANTQVVGLRGLSVKDTVGNTDITDVSGSKVQGDIGGKASGITGTVSTSQVTGLGTLAAKNSVSNGDVTDVALAKVTGAGALAGRNTVGDAQITDVTGSKVNGDITGKAAGFNGQLAGDLTGGQSSTFISKIKGWLVSIGNAVSGAVMKFNTSTNSIVSSRVDLTETTGQVTDSQVTALSGAKVNGDIGGNANSINGTVDKSHVGGLGQLSNKDTVTNTDITGTIDGSKIVGTINDGIVAGVGGSSAALIHQAEVSTNAATNLNTPSTVVKRAANGSINVGTVSSSGLAVTGSAVGAWSDAGNGTLIDFQNSNFSQTTAGPGTFSMQNLQTGGSYTLVLKSGIAGTYQLLFGSGTDVRCAPICGTTLGEADVAVDDQKHTVVTIIRNGTTYYISWLRNM